MTRPTAAGSLPAAAVVDPLHGSSYPKTYWSTTNVAEAMPGVQTPLGWTMWAPICELAIRGAFAATGALPRREVVIPDQAEDRTYNIFYGRAVLQVDAQVHDRSPQLASVIRRPRHERAQPIEVRLSQRMHGPSQGCAS